MLNLNAFGNMKTEPKKSENLKKLIVNSNYQLQNIMLTKLSFFL